MQPLIIFHSLKLGGNGGWALHSESREGWIQDLGGSKRKIKCRRRRSRRRRRQRRRHALTLLIVNGDLRGGDDKSFNSSDWCQ